ncbi:MAG: fasciclin domain-containing protein [Parvularculaceae bacterium]|nr:fasciclin domain-containing protein [Parvularculaceae bacterium]
MLRHVLAASAAFAFAVTPAFAGGNKTGGYASKPKADIVDTAVAAGQFNTLAAALKAAGLVETLKGQGPFTVFAPTDAAFAKLPAGTVETLLKPENKAKLTSILTYHVVAGKTKSKDLAGKTLSVKTVNGAEVAIDGTQGVKVGGATVTKADIWASNGVIHVIDTVLMPPQQ